MNALELPEEILEAEVKAICKRYRIDPESARTLLNRNFANRPELLQKILSRYPDEDVTRLRDYRNVIKAVKKQVYYQLRQYHKDKEKEKRLKKQLANLKVTSANSPQIDQLIEALLATHVSTQERFDHYPAFYQTLFSLIEPPQTILDIGCGLHPLSYPFNQPNYAPKSYTAIDKDPDAIETLTLFAPHAQPTRLTPLCADLTSLTPQDYSEQPGDKFDLAFMLKLIPVVHRHNQQLLEKLSQVPTQTLLITASTEAMTRKQDIKRREERVLRKFIAMSGRNIIAQFNIDTEFGYLLR